MALNWQSNQNRGWIFSPKIDLFVFGVSLLCAIALSKIFGVLPTGFLVFVFLDEINVFSTFFFTYTNKDLSNELKRELYLTPILSVTLLVAVILYFKIDAAIKFVELFTVYHFIKQQAAWFYIAAEKSRTPDLKYDRIINKIGIHSVTWGFTLCSLSNINYKNGWWRAEDLIQLPSILFEPLLILSGLGVLIYLVYHLFLFKKNWQLLPKHLQILYATIIWGGDRFLGREYGLDLLMVAGHTVPYLFLGSLYLIKQKEKNCFYLPKLNHKFLILFVYAGAASLAALEFFTRSLHYAFFLLWGTTNLMHFIIDGFFWKRKNNVDAASLFYPEPQVNVTYKQPTIRKSLTL